MCRRVLAAVWLTVIGGPVLAQPAAPPEVLPTTVLDPVARTIVGPTSPGDATKQRDALIKGLKEDLVTFEPGAVTSRLVDGRWQVRTDAVILKDFGTDRMSAVEAVRLLHDLRVNQMGIVKGSNPPFEYWLADGKPPRVSNSRAIVLPIAARSLRAENVGGTWVVTDGTKGLYDFGLDGDAAKQAATVYWKYGFNQLGVLGSKQPTMFYPLTDPAQATREKQSSASMSNAVGVVNDISKSSLLLPGNVYAGPKQPIDRLKLEVVRRERGEIALVHGNDVLARFGGVESNARSAMRALQDANVTEVARIGSTGFLLFLSNGQPIHGNPLGAIKMSIRSERLKIQKIRDTWWVTEDSRPLMEAGTRDDAELLVKVIQYFDLRAVCNFGRPETGGLRLLTMGR